MAGDTSEQTSSSSETSQEELNKHLQQNEQELEYFQQIIDAHHIMIANLPPPSLRHFEIARRAIGSETIHGMGLMGRTDAIHFPVQILEEPLTAQSLATSIATITDLHARCWLIQQKRFTDLMDYAQTRNARFLKEANLRVGVMTHNSPALIDFLISSGGNLAGGATLIFALKKGIDAIAQTPLRFQATKLKNEREVLEQKIREQEAQQEQKIAAQKAQLDIERQQLELERQQLELERQRLEFEKNRVKIVLEIATTMVGQLQSNISAGEKEMLVHSLVPPLLQFAAIDGIVTVIPLAQPDEEKKESSENK